MFNSFLYMIMLFVCFCTLYVTYYNVVGGKRLGTIVQMPCEFNLHSRVKEGFFGDSVFREVE